ncbi:hypothetical protein ACFQVC_02200 [Streptomyces monticola]|uniref:Lipoprotein n=1 Tax=Streptomyces monticola TaxID=2666263 RepID=A0ABW2JAL0_9ACTN
MRTRTGVRLAVPTALAATALTACGDGTDGPGGPSRQQIAWAEEFCANVGAGGAGLEVPDVRGARPATAQSDIAAFLDALAKRLDALGVKLQSQGAPPVEGGKAAYTEAMADLVETKRALADSQVVLRESTVKDAASLRSALRKSGAGLRGLTSYAGPAQALQRNRELRPAFDEADSCRVIGRAGPSAPDARK